MLSLHRDKQLAMKSRVQAAISSTSSRKTQIETCLAATRTICGMSLTPSLLKSKLPRRPISRSRRATSKRMLNLKLKESLRDRATCETASEVSSVQMICHSLARVVATKRATTLSIAIETIRRDRSEVPKNWQKIQ